MSDALKQEIIGSLEKLEEFSFLSGKNFNRALAMCWKAVATDNENDRLNAWHASDRLFSAHGAYRGTCRSTELGAALAVVGQWIYHQKPAKDLKTAFQRCLDLAELAR